MNEWYYAKQGQQNGPVSRDDLQRLIAAGTVGTQDYVWTEGMSDWQRARDVPGLVRADTGMQRPAAPDVSGAAADVPNYLAWAIVVTLCCCLPGGIVSIVYAAQSNAARNSGNMAAAVQAADKARQWIVWSVVLGLLANVAWLLLGGLAGVQRPMQF